MASITFTNLDADGVCGEVRYITYQQIGRCPHFILDPDHFPAEADLPCGCFNKDDPRMESWGYVWSNERRVWEGRADA